MTFRLGIAVGLGLIVGLGLGRYTAPQAMSAPPAEPPTVIAAPASRVAEVPPPVDLPSCQSELALARALLAAQERDRTGLAVPFPEDLPPIYTPDGFEDAVRTALAECPDLGLDIAQVECSEYPCMVFFGQPHGHYNHGVDDLAGCPGWSSRFTNPQRGQANGSFAGPDGESMEWSMLAPTPADIEVEDRENLGKRWRLRMDATAQDLMDAWGGRPFTELEKVERQIAFWEEQDGLDEEGSAMMLDSLYDQRAKLLERE